MWTALEESSSGCEQTIGKLINCHAYNFHTQPNERGYEQKKASLLSSGIPLKFSQDCKKKKTNCIFIIDDDFNSKTVNFLWMEDQYNNKLHIELDSISCFKQQRKECNDEQ